MIDHDYDAEARSLLEAVFGYPSLEPDDFEFFAKKLAYALRVAEQRGACQEIVKLEGALRKACEVLDDVLQQWEGAPSKFGEIQTKTVLCECLDALRKGSSRLLLRNLFDSTLS